MANTETTVLHQSCQVSGMANIAVERSSSGGARLCARELCRDVPGPGVAGADDGLHGGWWWLCGINGKLWIGLSLARGSIRRGSKKMRGRLMDGWMPLALSL